MPGPGRGQPAASYELQILPPSGGDWPVITDRPDTGLERGQQTEGAAIRNIMQYNHTVTRQETGETGETGGRTNTKELVNHRDSRSLEL